ncbi:family 3 adenylate cyclase [Mycobacteroides abscessus subsp. abscessus]|nr:family 3 adenylate cyclase [Mycobacteroides abscessus subsp. abscessus]
METNHKFYNFDNSLERIDEILDSASSFEDKDDIPKRDTLTYTNGYYLKCCALFVDLRDSSKLPQIHQKKVLAKIYRSYISEIVAILNGFENCKEINIVGDCVSAIFKGQFKEQVDDTLSAAAMIRSLIDILNYKLEKKGYTSIKAGIGLSWGRVLMIQAGYSGSGLNDVVWMGDAVNQASKMCSKAMKDVQDPIVVTNDFYLNLNDNNKKHFTASNPYPTLITPEYYSCGVVNLIMNDWIKQQTEQKNKPNFNSW